MFNDLVESMLHVTKDIDKQHGLLIESFIDPKTKTNSIIVMVDEKLSYIFKNVNEKHVKLASKKLSVDGIKRMFSMATSGAELDRIKQAVQYDIDKYTEEEKKQIQDIYKSYSF